MNIIVKLTKHESGFSNVPATYKVGDHDDGSSHLVSCASYILPAGYRIGETQLGEPAIYDDAGRHHEIVEHSSGRPQLVSSRREMPVLARSENHPSTHSDN